MSGAPNPAGGGGGEKKLTLTAHLALTAATNVDARTRVARRRGAPARPPAARGRLSGRRDPLL